jgi:hypothetical protein
MHALALPVNSRRIIYFCTPPLTQLRIGVYRQAMTKPILPEIEAFLARRPMSDFRFGIESVHNGRLMERLRGGGRVWPEQEERIRKYIASQLSEAV